MANIERLKHLIVILEHVDEEVTANSQGRFGFDINNWFEEDDCGTVACALGWAAIDPKFQAEGLFIDKNSEPEFEGAVTYLAGSHFFGISVDESCTLFAPYHYPSDMPRHDPKPVIARIKELINDAS